MRALVHASDLGNPTRTFDIAKTWGQLVMKEFLDQGDKEKALGYEITMMCDRATLNFPKSQIGFISFVIAPYYQILSVILPKLDNSV